MRIVVTHGMYGCDTGCCGHWVEVKDGTIPRKQHNAFEFDHADYGDDVDEKEAAKKFVRELVTTHYGEEHCKDIDWDNCVVVGDCDW